MERSEYTVSRQKASHVWVRDGCAVARTLRAYRELILNYFRARPEPKKRRVFSKSASPTTQRKINLEPLTQTGPRRMQRESGMTLEGPP